MIDDRPVSAIAEAAVVLRHFVVDLTTAKRDTQPDPRVRVILVKTTPHTKRGGRNGARSALPATVCRGSPRTSGMSLLMLNAVFGNLITEFNGVFKICLFVCLDLAPTGRSKVAQGNVLGIRPRG
ncbi:hypothetical protein SAMN05444166_5813 [Singulisphaera sp. GP187]|nr:hypothetical protein SAMN05444166_5813 [Singulisphaera sp. GP187]